MSEEQKVSEYNSQESIPKMLDEAYNAGIDRAIDLLNSMRAGQPLTSVLQSNPLQNAVFKLQQLKK